MRGPEHASTLREEEETEERLRRTYSIGCFHHQDLKNNPHE